MFGDFVLNYSSAKYNNRIMLIDDEGLDEITHYSDKFKAYGFEIVHYNNDLIFRINYEEKLKNTEDKLLVLSRTGCYIPYDIQRKFRVYTISINRLFPKLNTEVIKANQNLDLELLCMAYIKNFEDLRQRKQTEEFIQQNVNSPGNVVEYLEQFYAETLHKLDAVKSYKDWFVIAEAKAKIDVLAIKYNLDFDTDEINRVFRDYVLVRFGKLSTEINRETPVLVSRAMEYMHDHSSKFVTQTSHPKNIHIHNNIAVMQPLTSQTDRRN